MRSSLAQAVVCASVLCCGSAASAQQVIQESIRLTASDGGPGDLFGRSAAIDGATVVVGAVNADQRGLDAGAAYVFDAITGVQQRRLLAQDGDDEEFFGVAVGVSDGRVIVGSSQNDAADTLAGAAYIFGGPMLRQTDQLLPTSSQPVGPGFSFSGFSVAIDSSFAVVGAPGDIEITNGGGGAIYVYETGSFNNVQKLFSSDAAFADNFGTKVAVSGDLVVASTPFDDDNGTDSGSVYVFDAITGAELRKLTPSDGDTRDFFGLSIALDGDTLAVGAPFANNEGGVDAGAVYLFDAITGDELRRITPADFSPNGAGEGDVFGFAVDLDGGLLVVGAPRNDERGDGAGVAYVFDVASGARLATLAPSDAATGAAFGGAVGVSDDLIVVAAEGDGQNGEDAGAAYVFAFVPAPCFADLTTDGLPNGVPDKLITLSDFSFYLALWSQADPAADITLAGVCEPSIGGGDGVTLSDFSCYLSLWSQGCP